MESDTRPTVLLADDDRDVRELSRLFLEMEGFDVDEAANGAEALQRFFSLDLDRTPGIVVLDDRMPVLSGLEVAERILLHRPEQVVVLFSADLDSPLTQRAGSLGVAACLLKTDLSTLPASLRGLLAAA